MIAKSLLQIALCLLLVMVSSAHAQQAPAKPAPPANVIDLGDVGIGQTVVSADLPITNGQNIWFSFRLTEAVTPDTWLNIDTSRSTINTEIGMYNEWAHCVLSDDFSGGGLTLANSTSAALTFGGGSGERLGEDGAGWVGGRMDTGWNEYGASWRPYLRSGTFYICVVGYNADFSQCPNPNWQVSTNYLGTGIVRLRIRSGMVPTTRWNEYHHGADAGDTPGGAQIINGSGTLESILCTYLPGERDIFKFRICDPANFRVVATPTLQWGDLYNARLFLFDSTGRGVLGINNSAGGDTVLAPPAGVQLQAGEYYLAVSSRCGGIDGFQAVPYDAQGQALWNFAESSSWNRTMPPNGTGAANPMYVSGRQADCHSNSYAFFVRLRLTGACRIEPCQADLDRDGTIEVQDLFLYLDAFFSGCQ